jgi:hypothetical protein
VLAFVLGQLQRCGMRVDYHGAGTGFTAALKPNVAVAADAGQRRQLLSPQAGRPPPTVIHRQADVGWVGAAGAQALAHLDAADRLPRHGIQDGSPIVGLERPPLGVIEGGNNVG